ncbi:phenylacetate-CoA oxygenase subunit PaaJ [Haloechinothrix sp. YIM 98757]|uniref:Phenylacetate-CoA oxygenase subunit PaaJ n=1 Tax=Haloechinothrix aidingensis TaxID=2752311 RepID=A0A838ABU6_9PSEU|nr:1,2-phenylacetyl-CoA epoxidase subunit PaaD [Haloechinothrix aidingensis]MBA0126658.1 phenylacetate-CoA oxygenase subunit PaaJ [Haloechinothrix aidingensis]
MVTTREHARAVAARVTDPELPMLTLADLGVLRDVTVTADGVVVTITPTYSGCPALETMRDDLVSELRAAGYRDVTVRTALHPPWSSDWISEDGRRKLAEAGIAPPGPAPAHGQGPIPLTLHTPRSQVPSDVCCPWCGSAETAELSRFGATACRALRTCSTCAEPFEHVKEI